MSICPHCGTPYPVTEREIEQVSGDLVEATEADKALLRKTRKLEVGRARTREALELLAKERGYEPDGKGSYGFVHYVMAAREKNKHNGPITGTIKNMMGQPEGTPIDSLDNYALIERGRKL